MFFLGCIYTSMYHCEIDQIRFFVQMAMTLDYTSLYTKWKYQLYQYSDHLDIDEEKHDVMTKEAWSLRKQHALQSDVLVKQPCTRSALSRWWFQTFFIFHLTWGNDPIWLIFFKWVETTTQTMIFPYFFRVCSVHIEKSEPLPPLPSNDWSIKASPSRSNCSFQELVFLPQSCF